MKIINAHSALALLLAAHTQTAWAQDDTIIVESTLLHPAAGLMNEHMHNGGEVMIGLRFERTRNAGSNRRGTEAIADPAILASGYTSRIRAMTMDMVMLDLMFAPSDRLTLMAMPHYMWHRMEMVGIDPASGAGGGGHAGHGAGHAIPFGDVHAHATQGFGDTLLSASYRLARSRRFNAHATLGVWTPTGRVNMKNADGSFVHYGMQPGSGTWDLEPSVTVAGRSGTIGWGAQGTYRWRSENHNASGYSLGDRARASGWVSKLLGPDLGATARLEYLSEGAISGHYNGPHNHAAPPDRQENYGGDTISAALGLNWLLPTGQSGRPQLGLEMGVPVYQDLNGIQAPQRLRVSAAISQAF